MKKKVRKLTSKKERTRNEKREGHVLDYVMLVALPLFAAVYTISFKPSFLFAALIFLGLPALWLSLRKPQLIVKSGIFGAVLALPLSLIIDYLAVRDGSWYVSESFFPRILNNTVVLEDILWTFLFVYFVVVFYEYFFDHIGREHMTPRLKHLLYITLSLIFLFFVIYLSMPAMLDIPYAYFWMGIVFALIPIIAIALKLPKLIHKFLGVTGYFFLFCLIYEVAGLKAGIWVFPGKNFIGSVMLMGLSFPLEELIFWMLLSSGAILALYEYFDDDRR